MWIDRATEQEKLNLLNQNLSNSLNISSDLNDTYQNDTHLNDTQQLSVPFYLGIYSGTAGEIGASLHYRVNGDTGSCWVTLHLFVFFCFFFKV